MKLKRFSFTEKLAGRLSWKIDNLELDDFILITGESCQGKTRLINVLKFLKALHTRNFQFPAANVEMLAEMDFTHSRGSIYYRVHLVMTETSDVPIIWDHVALNKTVLLDRQSEVLWSEEKKELIGHFNLQKNLPVISQVNAEQFPLLRELRRFFEGILFFDCHRFDGRRMEVTEGRPILNEFGSNLGSVLKVFQEQEPHRFRQIQKTFTDCFPRIEPDSLIVQNSQPLGATFEAPILFLTEKGVESPIPHTEWSDGLLRILSFIVLPHSRTSSDFPSLICLDEIDNGLDINGLSQALSYFEGATSQTQVLMTTHSPLASSLIDGARWRVIHRDGHRVFFDQADRSELEGERKNLVKAHYDFFRKHVSRSRSGNFN